MERLADIVTTNVDALHAKKLKLYIVVNGPRGNEMAEFSPTEITNREHIAPDKSGDNIAAKRVAGYGFDGTNWQRMPTPLVDGAYDDIVFGAYDSFGMPSSISFKKSGSTVRTLTLTGDGSGNVTEIART
jgi:hypothetical protein